jgi:hypothetical protein
MFDHTNTTHASSDRSLPMVERNLPMVEQNLTMIEQNLPMVNKKVYSNRDYLESIEYRYVKNSAMRRFLNHVRDNDVNYVKKNHHMIGKKTLDESFMVACSSNHDTSVISYIVNKLKINIVHNDKDSSNGFTVACEYNQNLNVIRYLVNELKININHTSNFECNGFSYACWNNPNVNVIKYLVDELKLDITNKNADGSNAFNMACGSNPNPDVIKYLIDELKMDTQNTDNENIDGFSNACRMTPNFDVIRYLSEQTNIKQSLTSVNFGAFEIIIESLCDTNNYVRFSELLELGIQKYKNQRLCMTRLLNNINPLMLTKTIIKTYGMCDMFDNKFKYFVTKFNKLPISVKEYYMNAS